MATTPLEIEAIKEYLISVGCKIEYPILVNAFKKHLYNPDPSVQGKVRTQFKDYVNQLATVSLENNMKFIILRPEFRPSSRPLQLPDGREQASKQQQQQQGSPPNFMNQPALNDAHKAPTVNGKLPQAAHEPRRPRSITIQQPQQVRQQQLMLSSKLNSQPNHDQMDSPRLTQQNGNPQHFPFPSNQVLSPIHSHISQQQQQQQPPPPPLPPFPQHQTNSINQLDEPMSANHQSRSSRSMQYADDNANQQKSLPPTMQLHTRTQSQPVPIQTHFYNHQHNPQPSSVHQQHQSVLSPLAVISNNVVNSGLLHDDSTFLMPPPPPPHGSVSNQHLTSSPLRPSREQLSNQRQDTPIIARTTSTVSPQMPPPRPPPRRRQSTASLFKPNPTKLIEKGNRESMQEQARKNISGRVREHATRFNSSASTSDLSALMPKRNSSMKENRLSRESVFSGLTSALQRNGSQTRSRSSHRGEDESDSSSLQPIDPLRRKWAIEACSCNYNNLVSLLREDPKLASCRDIVNGYTALHWAAKFGNLDIIELIAGAHQISANIKSSAGHTPLHVAYMFNRLEAANMLIQNYRANQDVRDHSGKKPKYYSQKS